MRWMVTGASRGIGRAIVDVLAARGDEVVAAVRDPSSMIAPPGVMVLALDVASPASAQEARAAFPFDTLDVLVSNAARNGGPQRAPGMDLERAAEIVTTNALGPLYVYDAFVDLLRLGAGKKLVHVSSEAGSLSHFRASSKPEYGMSKAALNALTRWVAAVEAEIVCASIDPGWTRTAMGGEGAGQSTEEAAAGMVAAVDRLTREHSGGFWDLRLEAIPW